MQERELEITACTEAVVSAARGEGKCILLHGGAGTGKSALLNEVANDALEHGVTVVQFRGSHAEHDFPLNLAIQVVKFVAEENAADVRSHLGGSPSGTVLAALEGHEIPRDLPDDVVRGISRDLLSALIQLIRKSSGKAALLAVDNLHWVDRCSLQWLAALLERLPSLPLAVIATVCDGLGGTDPDLLDEVSAGAARSLKVKPLGPAGTAAVIESALNRVPHPSFVGAAIKVTDGNPLLLEALLGAAAEAGMCPETADAGQLESLRIDSLAPSLRVRLRRISPEAISVFRVAAALGGDATVQNIAELSGIEPANIAENCYAMRKMGLLSADDTTAVIAQPLLANSVLQDSAPSVLREVHSQAARLLHDLGAPDCRVATHLLVSGVLSDSPWVCETLRSAAREAVATHDTPTAVRYLRRALDEPISQTARAAVQTDLALAAAGDNVEEAARLVGRALKLSLHEVGKQTTPDLLIMLGLGEYWDEVSNLYGAAQGSNAALDSCLLILEQCVQTFPSAISLPSGVVEPTGHPGVLFRACGMARSGQDREDAIALASQVARRPAHSIEQLIHQLLAARVLSAAGELSMAMRASNMMVTATEIRRQPSVLAIALADRSRVALRLGRIDSAAEDARRALSLVGEASFRKDTSVFASVVAQMVNVLTAKGVADEALALMGDVGSSVVGAPLLHALGHLRVTTGDTRGGVTDLLACGEYLAARGAVNPALAPWRSRAAQGLSCMGDREEAQRLLGEELSLARLWGAPATVAHALRAHATLFEPAVALPMLEEAVTLLRTSEDRLALTHALCERARLLTEADVASARQSFREAYELAVSLGNDDQAAEIRRELVLHGGRAPRVHQQGVDSLTDSERKVATLAAEGRKNREIAAILYVEKRTVEIHLTHTYRKLGIDSRRELPAILRQAGSFSAPEKKALHS